MPELDEETRAEIAKLCCAASNIALRLSHLPPDEFNELSTVLNIGINRVRVHYGLPTGWRPDEEWAIVVAHGDLTAPGPNDLLVEPAPSAGTAEIPDAPAEPESNLPRRRLFQ